MHAAAPAAATLPADPEDGAPAPDAPLGEDARVLVRTAAVLAVGDDQAVRTAVVAAAASDANPVWVEEVILQTYLFAGFPRALNAMREWRRASGRRAPAVDADTAAGDLAAWTARGEATCATVYGPFYAKLRPNIAALHPALDAWMVVEGYGKVLGRSEMPLPLRELCVVAVCAASRQERQLHSHLHGALHAGAPASHVSGALDAVADLLDADARAHVARLWAHVQATQGGDRHHAARPAAARTA